MTDTAGPGKRTQILLRRMGVPLPKGLSAHRGEIIEEIGKLGIEGVADRHRTLANQISEFTSNESVKAALKVLENPKSGAARAVSKRPGALDNLVASIGYYRLGGSEGIRGARDAWEKRLELAKLIKSDLQGGLSRRLNEKFSDLMVTQLTGRGRARILGEWIKLSPEQRRLIDEKAAGNEKAEKAVETVVARELVLYNERKHPNLANLNEYVKAMSRERRDNLKARMLEIVGLPEKRAGKGVTPEQAETIERVLEALEPGKKEPGKGLTTTPREGIETLIEALRPKPPKKE